VPAAFLEYERRFRRLIEQLDAEERERRPDA
jgi:hypothetical protein